MASGDLPALSLRPYPVSSRAPKNVADFIARVNAQPGGFRDLTEQRLRDAELEEARRKGHTARQDAAMSEAGDQDEGDEDEDEDEEQAQEDAAKELEQTRADVLRSIDIAANTAMLTLDSLSLLLSKQNPTQASLTLSHQLRDMVGIGTLGSDKLDDTAAVSVPEAKAKDDDEVALGWVLMEINRTRDAAAEASRFLRAETAAEARYWEDVVRVHKAGWGICSVPGERHVLGVRFGFSEAAADFRKNGIAPMRRGPNGSVQLDCGKLGGVSERLLVTYTRRGRAVGRSSLPAPTADDAPLEARILEARNTLFAQEIWHELSREARSLLSYDVRPNGRGLIFALDPSSSIILELVPLDGTVGSDASLPENALAESVSVSLHLLLSYAHRYNELMRMRPLPPHLVRSRGRQTYALLRPIIVRVVSIRSIRSCASYISNLVATLRMAGLAASFSLHTPQHASLAGGGSPRGPNKLSSAQTLVWSLLQPLEFLIKLTILPQVSLTIRGRTLLYPVTATHYQVLVDPSSALQRICPPIKEGYADTTGLLQYLRIAVARALVEHLLMTRALSITSETAWIRGISGTSIQKPADGQRPAELALSVRPDPPVLALTFSWATEGGKSQSATVKWDPEDPEEDDLDETVRQLISRA